MPSPPRNGSFAIAVPARPQGRMRRRDAVVSHHHIRTTAVVRASSSQFLRKRGLAGCASAGCGSTGHASPGFGLVGFGLIDRLLGERHSIKERVGELRAGFLVNPSVLHRIDLLFQWLLYCCAKKYAFVCHLDTLCGRQSAAASLLARMNYSSLCGGGIIICLRCLSMPVLSHMLFKR